MVLRYLKKKVTVTICSELRVDLLVLSSLLSVFERGLTFTRNKNNTSMTLFPFFLQKRLKISLSSWDLNLFDLKNYIKIFYNK